MIPSTPLRPRGRSRAMLLVVLGSMLGFAPSAVGQVYRYTDEQGQTHITDDPNKIPERFRPRPAAIPDSPPAPATSPARRPAPTEDRTAEETAQNLRRDNCNTFLGPLRQRLPRAMWEPSPGSPGECER